jgi:hypothetical protein
MNPGIVSLLLICIALILVATGWKEALFGGIPSKAIVIFIAMWLFSTATAFEWAGSVWNGSFFCTIIVVGYLLIRKLSGSNWLQSVTLGALLGSVHFMIDRMLNAEPILVYVNLDLDLALLMAIVTALMLRDAPSQAVSISIGLLLGEIFQAYWRHMDSIVQLGGSSFQDTWWIAMLSARLMTLVMQTVYLSYRSAVRIWMDRRREWRK